MPKAQSLSRVYDLLDPERNLLYGTTVEEARETLARGQIDEIRNIDGQFALVATNGSTVRLARTLGRPMRYFVAKLKDGPALVVSDRIDAIHQWLKDHQLDDQFHPSYTRMVPAHHVVKIRLVGCPDPNPTYQRFFTPERGALPANLDLIGESYIRAVYFEVTKWLRAVPANEPIGVCFSGGIDSGSVLVLTYHAMLTLGMKPSRLKAFTLSVDGCGDDLKQAREFVQAMDLELLLEEIDVPRADIDPTETVRLIEDYKPLDVQAAAMARALCQGIRQRYPNWKYLLDGDGGDENLKGYPIEENPELTIRSVLTNLMLYQEGWGVDSIKHSLTYSGGQSRGCVRTYAPASTLGFATLSPYTARSVITVAEAIPFVDLTDWDHERLYNLKGEIVTRGVRVVTRMEMPLFAKRRFQHGAMPRNMLDEQFPRTPNDYRKLFHAIYE